MQQLTLPSLNVVSNSNADKSVKSAVNNQDNDVFASELDRRVNDHQQSAKDKTAKADSKIDSKQTEKNDKAEKSESKDGKKLPLEKTDKSTAKTEKETDKIASEEAAETSDEAKHPLILSVTPVTDEAGGKKISAQQGLVNKTNLPQITDVTADKKTSDLVASVIKPTAQGIGVQTGKSNNADSPATTIRADILQAIQKQGGEGEAVATEKFKSMMQNASKMPQQTNAASAEAIASMRQVEPLTEKGPASTLSNPLVFSATTGTATPVAGVASAGGPALSLDIQPQLNNAAWARVMSSRVVWMAREGVQQAELRLNPAHLGPVEVRLSMQNEQTSVTFVASNAAARDALEQALPRLRESFSDNGLALNHAEVSHQDQSSQSSEQDEQLQDGNNTAQVIIEMDDMDDEAALTSADSTDNSVGVSVFA